MQRGFIAGNPTRYQIPGISALHFIADGQSVYGSIHQLTPVSIHLLSLEQDDMP